MLQGTKAVAHRVEQAQVGLVVCKCRFSKRVGELVREFNYLIRKLGARVVGWSSSGILHPTLLYAG